MASAPAGRFAADGEKRAEGDGVAAVSVSRRGDGLGAGFAGNPVRPLLPQHPGGHVSGALEVEPDARERRVGLAAVPDGVVHPDERDVVGDAQPGGADRRTDRSCGRRRSDRDRYS